jgi:sporulation protein YlmC with PRC-barrel domain
VAPWGACVVVPGSVLDTFGSDVSVILHIESSNTSLISLLLGVLILKVGNMNGMNVITADAYTLGEIDGAHADTATWQITHLDVALTKEATRELGFKKPMLGSLTVCLPVTAVEKVGDVITLNKSLLEFKSLKECKAE